MAQETIIRFDEVSYGYTASKLLLSEASCNIRSGSKITIMGQNGAGKSTTFSLIQGILKPISGRILAEKGLHIAIGRQVMSAEDKLKSVHDYFRGYSRSDAHSIERDIKEVLDVVNFLPKVPAGSTQTKEEVFQTFLQRQVGSFSGGQQARLLLAAALIQDPDILLLDEPTNNLDKEGIDHLISFLQAYQGTVLVISHDAEFLNAFTDGILYLDVFTKKIDQFVGNYYDAVEKIQARIEAQNQENVRLEKEIRANKEQANVFAHKGGKLRAVAKKMVEKAEELEASKGDVRREDRTIREFEIPAQEGVGGIILSLERVSVIRHHQQEFMDTSIRLGKNKHLLLSGPNGIGKSTLLESIARGTCPGAKIGENVKIGYYRQDFSTLDFSQRVYDSLMESAARPMTEKELRSAASGFLITGDIMMQPIGVCSEGQKGLIMFCKLMLEEPGLLILDEPTNHINFRHLPIIAQALDSYKGTMVLVSHMDEFVWQVRIDEYLELE